MGPLNNENFSLFFSRSSVPSPFSEPSCHPRPAFFCFSFLHVFLAGFSSIHFNFSFSFLSLLFLVQRPTCQIPSPLPLFLTAFPRDAQPFPLSPAISEIPLRIWIWASKQQHPSGWTDVTGSRDQGGEGGRLRSANPPPDLEVSLPPKFRELPKGWGGKNFPENPPSLSFLFVLYCISPTSTVRERVPDIPHVIPPPSLPLLVYFSYLSLLTVTWLWETSPYTKFNLGDEDCRNDDFDPGVCLC